MFHNFTADCLRPDMQALDLLPERATTLLDVGCNDGDTLLEAARLGVVTVRGIDINPEAALKAANRVRHLPDAEAVHGSGDELPFEDGAFDVVTCLEVLEHIPAALRPGAMAQIVRVLRPGGHLILSVPFRGMSAWLDPENLRFHLPSLHDFVSRRIGGRGKEAGYADQKHGVVYHHHFTKAELLDLLSPALQVEVMRGRGFLFYPLGAWVRWPFYRRNTRNNPICRVAEWAMAKEMRLPVPQALAFDVLLRAKKI